MNLSHLAVVGCTLLVGISALGADAPLIPPALAEVIARIKPKMTGQQAREQVAAVYPDVQGGISDWAGAVGQIVFRLDKHWSVKFSAQEPESGVLSYKTAVLPEKPRIQVSDYEHKRRFEISQAPFKISQIPWTTPGEAQTTPEHPGTIFLTK